MSHEVNDNIRDQIRDLYDLITFLECELETASSHGRIAEADDVAGELYDARKELATLEGHFA